MLTIAIPTYNRAMYLREQLSDILDQMKDGSPKGVDILVSDNCSTDETVDVVRSFESLFREIGSRLIYRKNSSNIGFSPNVDAAIRSSPDEHVLVMGDDDGLEPGTLSYVIDLLRRYPFADMLFLAARPYDFKMKKALADPCLCDNVVVYRDGVKYILRHRAFPPALISGCVFRRTSWIDSQAERFNYSIGVHSLAAANMMIDHRCVVESFRASIKYRTGQTNSTWSADPTYPFRFVLDDLVACKMFRDKSDRKTHRVLYRLTMRIIAFYLIRQKVTKHPFNAQLIYSKINEFRTDVNFYVVLISIVRHLPRLVVCLLFGRMVKAHVKRFGI